MGWGMGMAIGWPNVNNQASPPNYVYFIVNSFCIGGEFSPGTTQLLLAGTYSPGDYVYVPALKCRVLLGEIVSEPGAVTYEVSGLAYSGCDVVEIDGDYWTTTNLDVATYRDGTPIPQVTDSAAWAALTTGAWCYYDNDPANEPTYGKLYNWHAVNDPRGLAPTGYHVPEDTEWTTLTNYLGGNNFAGGQMKETGLSHWLYPNTGANNGSGFTGLPGGYRYNNGTFNLMARAGSFWSSTKIIGTSNAYQRALNHDSEGVLRNAFSKKFGQSVRLKKD